MTTIEEALGQGFDVLLATGARSYSASTGETVPMLVEDAPEIGDPMQPLQAKTPLYARLSCKDGAVAAPYGVATFTEAGTGKIYTVLRYEEDLMGVSQRWLCEKQR